MAYQSEAGDCAQPKDITGPSNANSFTQQSTRSHFQPTSSPGRYQGLSVSQLSNQPSSAGGRNFSYPQPYSKPSSQDSTTAKMSIASNIPSKTKYSFGLYFPPKSTPSPNNNNNDNGGGGGSSGIISNVSKSNAMSGRTFSSESLSNRGGREDSALIGTTKSSELGDSQRRADQKYRKASVDETSQKSASARSRDYFIRYSTEKSNSDARNRFALRHSTHERSSMDKPTYVITRSQTVAAIAPGQSAGSTSQARSSGDFSTKTTRRRGSEDLEYKTELSRQVHQVSTASVEPKPGIKVTSYSRDNGAGNNNMAVSKKTATVSTTSNSGGSKTFVVRIPCDQQQPVVTISQGRESTHQTPSRQSYGTAFALKRTPLATHIEIQKAIGKPIVSQRKSQFESKLEESQPPARVFNPLNRYKMEIDRMRTQPKFSSVAYRKASFEQSPDRDEEDDMSNSGSNDPLDSAANQSPTPVVKIRKISKERYNASTPPPQSSGYQRERAPSTCPANALSAPTSVGSSSSSSYLDSSSPIRIVVSPGTNNQQLPSSPAPPVVEIVSVYSGDKSGEAVSMKDSLSSSLFGDDPQHHQRHHSSPSPSSLSTGTMGDSGVWVKSYHSSSDMLDSNSGGGGVSITLPSSTAATWQDAATCQDFTNNNACVLPPRQRHQSFLDAVNSPRGGLEGSSSPASSSSRLPQQPLPQASYRGVHTQSQSPQQMVAQSQSVPLVPSIATSSLPSPSPASIYSSPPPQGSSGLHTYSQTQPQPATFLSSDPKQPHQPPHLQPPQEFHPRQPTSHQQQQQQQPPLLPGSSSSHSLSSIGSDTAIMLPCLTHTVISTSDNLMPAGGAGGSSANVSMASSKSNTSLSVPLRRKQSESQEDQASKLHRRTSYLMATAKDRTNTVPIEQAFSPMHKSGSDQQLSPPQEASSLRRDSSVKLNKFFGEEIPSISESVESKSVDEEEPTPPPTPPPEVIRKGPVSCKIAVMEGKKCSDRTWKPVYAILRQTEMVVSRDPNSSTSNNFETQHIPLKSCMVEFARDYAKKKKNVFRLTTQQECEYLFQAEDRGTMLCWIQALKSINEPDKAEKMDEMIAHETSKHAPVPVEIHVIPSSKLSPPLGHMAKKLSGLSLRSKLTSSPNMRRKKSNASEKDKEKDEGSSKRGWKGRIMMKNTKKHSEDSLAPPSIADPDPMADCCRQFGMPIEDCFPSPHNEYVPLIVELCTRIVEARGLEVIGVYRVPGNSAAVNALIEEFNRGIDNVNIDNEKLLDINVISSLLKSFFRKLPEPLVNNASYDGFIEANRNPDPDKRMLKLKRLLHLLPTHHNETFKHMAEHLNKVASYGNINKMDAKNLAIMFGPTLIRKSHDDAVSLVTDMSDQCRIIESIILHHEWFFSPWDQDSHIPIDTKVETVLLNEGHGEKDDDEEADSAISTKEIISSIVGAASRKLRGQQQKSEDSLDSACSLFPSNISSQDRPFYQETKGPDVSRLTSLSSSKSHTSIVSAHSEDVISGHGLSSSTQRLAQEFLPTHVTNSEPDFLDLEFADAGGSMSPVFPRHFSDDSMLDKNDELEISHGLGTSMSRQTIHNTLKRIGNDVKTLLQTFEQKQMIEMERRRKEQELIEHEHLRTQLELEQEDSRSIDDWLALRGAGGISHMPDLVSSSFMGNPRPLDHSQCDRHERLDRDRTTLKSSSTQLSQVPPFHSHQGSFDSAVSRAFFDSPHTDSLYPGVHPHPYMESPPLSTIRNHLQKTVPASKHKNIHLAVEKQHLRPSSFRMSMGRRHGSLDSLIDLIDKRSSWASSDSEDGSDLLTSLTSTFDQKLQILVNPKYKLTGTGSRKHRGSELVKPATIVSDMKETASLRSGDTLRAKQAFLNPSMMPPSVLDSDRPFRDPSLHRSSKPEAKIGIASRFERNDNRALSPPAVSSSDSSSSPDQRSPRKVPLPDYGAFLNRHNVGQSLRDGTFIALTQPKKLEDSGVYVLRSLNKSRNNESSRSISKSEKTEMNSNLARLSKEEKGLIGTVEGDNKQENKENKRRRKNDRKNGRRRHTVGGTQDFEHIDALVQVCASGEEDGDNVKLSAWDQLRPAVKDGGDRNLQTWLQKERTRGSTPDLTIGD